MKVHGTSIWETFVLGKFDFEKYMSYMKERMYKHISKIVDENQLDLKKELDLFSIHSNDNETWMEEMTKLVGEINGLFEEHENYLDQKIGNLQENLEE